MAKHFEVTFYREIVGDNGHCRELPLDVLQVDGVATQEKAITTAILRFEQRKHVVHWNNLASRLEVHEVPASPRLLKR